MVVWPRVVTGLARFLNFHLCCGTAWVVGKMGKSQFRHLSSRHGSFSDSRGPKTWDSAVCANFWVAQMSQPGHGLDLEIVERNNLPPRKPCPMTGKERDMPWMVAAEAWISYRDWAM